MRAITKLLWILMLVQACGPSTHISGTWSDPQYRGKTFKNIIVVAMTDNVKAKQTVETALQEKLGKSGIKVEKSTDIFPVNFTDGSGNKEKILDKVRQNGNDGILTVSLVDTKTETRYVPGNNPYTPYSFGYYGSFGGYYNYMYPRLYSQGYYAEDKTYYIETNLYDAATEKLVWSAQSETYNPSDLNSFSQDFAQVTAERIKKEGVL